MDLRGSSTALDTVLFVLLVGAAVAVLAGATPQASAGPQRVAAETADVLATGTTTVAYNRSGTVRDGRLLRGDGGTRPVTVERRAHGTYAELLAAATVAGPELAGRSLTGTGGDLEAEVAEATARALPTESANVQVRATWRPYPGARIGQTVVVGERPPPDADVTVARLAVPSGFPNVGRRLGADPGFRRVARAVAAGVVEGLFPPARTRDALASEGSDRAVVAERYRTASAALRVDVAGPLAEGEVTAANDRLVRALTERLRRTIEARFASPAAVARELSVDRVSIVVRTWSS